MSSPAVTTIHHRLTARPRAAEAAAAILAAAPHTAAVADTAPTAVAAAVHTAAADADKAN